MADMKTIGGAAQSAGLFLLGGMDAASGGKLSHAIDFVDKYGPSEEKARMKVEASKALQWANMVRDEQVREREDKKYSDQYGLVKQRTATDSILPRFAAVGLPPQKVLEALAHHNELWDAETFRTAGTTLGPNDPLFQRMVSQMPGLELVLDAKQGMMIHDKNTDQTMAVTPQVVDQIYHSVYDKLAPPFVAELAQMALARDPRKAIYDPMIEAKVKLGMTREAAMDDAVKYINWAPPQIMQHVYRANSFETALGMVDPNDQAALLGTMEKELELNQAPYFVDASKGGDPRLWTVTMKDNIEELNLKKGDMLPLGAFSEHIRKFDPAAKSMASDIQALGVRQQALAEAAAVGDAADIAKAGIIKKNAMALELPGELAKEQRQANKESASKLEAANIDMAKSQYNPPAEVRKEVLDLAKETGRELTPKEIAVYSTAIAPEYQPVWNTVLATMSKLGAEQYRMGKTEPGKVNLIQTYMNSVFTAITGEKPKKIDLHAAAAKLAKMMGKEGDKELIDQLFTTFETARGAGAPPELPDDTTGETPTAKFGKSLGL